MNLSYLTDQVDELVDEFIDGAIKVPHDEVIKRTHLDPRALGSYIWISEDFVAIKKFGCNALDYYGGFEYIDKDCRYTLGDYVFYSADDERVQSLLDDLSDLLDGDLVNDEDE